MTSGDPRQQGGPAPRRIGRFELLHAIGRGAMGEVHVARDGDRKVALKRLLVPNARMVSAIRREMLSLSLLSHPGIVRIVDHGVDEGMPWYAMELLEGTSLAEALPSLREGRSVADVRSAPTQPVVAPDVASPRGAPAAPAPGGRAAPARDLAALLAILRQLCDPLAAMHRAGIVHRDLKPANVVLRPDGTPVIVDFGLAAHFAGRRGRERFDLSGEIAGTVAYMAPEQARGELVDPRADLYALGCMLFEMISGTPPFSGASTAEVLAHHMATPAPRPGAFVPDVPPAVDELAARLLAKEPRERIGYADDVARLLDEIAGGARRPPSSAAYLYRPAMAGRDTHLASLEKLAHKLRRRPGAIAVVGGREGSGKTRFAMEAARALLQSGKRVVYCRGLGAGEPLACLEPLLEAARDDLRQRGEEASGAALREALAAFDALPVDEDPDPVTELPRRPTRKRTFLALADLLAEVARPGLLLVLDDAHDADELTLAFVEHLAGDDRLADVHALLLLTHAADASSEMLRRLRRRGVAMDVELDDLRPDELLAIAGDMLALPPAASVDVALRAVEGAGRPGLVAEYLRAAIGEGRLVRDDDGRWRFDGVPVLATDGVPAEGIPAATPSLDELARARVAGVGDPARGVLAAAAVLGGRVDEELLAELAGGGDVDLGISDLLRREILELDDSGRLRFVHQALERAAHETIPEAPRAALHRAAAELLERRGVPGREAAIARHLEEASDPAAAAACVAAARRASARTQYGEMERLYRRALAIAGLPPDEQERIQGELGYALYRAGKFEQAGEEAAAALAAARARGDGAAASAALRCLGISMRALGRDDEARARYGEAIAAARDGGHQVLQAFAQVNLAGLEVAQGRLPEARALYEEALAIQRAAGAPSSVAIVLGNLGTLRFREGRAKKALALLGEALALQRELGDRRSQAITLANLGLVLERGARYEEARASFEEAIAIHREVGELRLEALALANLALCEESLGDRAAARETALRAIALHRRFGDRAAEAAGRVNLGTFAFESGDLDGAAASYAAALELAERSGAPWLARAAERAVARVRLVSGAGLGELEARLVAASAALRAEGNAAELVPQLCAIGHARLAGPPSQADVAGARQLLAEAGALAAELEAGDREVGEALAWLEHAVREIDQGRALVGGYAEADLPPAILARLAAQRAAAEAAGPPSPD